MPVPAGLKGSGAALVLCAVDEDGEVEDTWVADERGGFVSAKLDRFGLFEVRQDSVAPTLGQPKWANGQLRIAVGDDLSGIARWEGKSGDQWLRWSMDKGVLTYRLDDGMLTGREDDEIKVWAIDGTGNIGHINFRLVDLKQ